MINRIFTHTHTHTYTHTLTHTHTHSHTHTYTHTHSHTHTLTHTHTRTHTNKNTRTHARTHTHDIYTPYVQVRKLKYSTATKCRHRLTSLSNTLLMKHCHGLMPTTITISAEEPFDKCYLEKTISQLTCPANKARSPCYT